MNVAGKCPPEPEELHEAEEKGFNNVELYLEKKHVNRLEKTLKACRRSNLNVVSVHTPHVTPEEEEYLEKAGELAEELEAYLVIHSQCFHHVHIPELEKLSIQDRYGYENNPGISVYHLEKTILEKDHDLVLDTAHLYMSGMIEELPRILREWSNQIKVIHLCDSTDLEDGLAFGAGDMEMEKIIQGIKASEFDGIVVLEVMPEHQEEALEIWRNV
ncbi:MAG: sugar phosphate isomerase/epimerase family protein [Candidatus Nanohaloarchaea archaeon]